MTLSLEEILVKVKPACDPRELFGDDPAKAIRDYRAALHPDRFPGEPDRAAKADLIRRHIDRLYEQLTAPIQTIKSPKRTYRLLSQIATGDVADIYLANSQESDAKYIVKCSRVPEGAGMLKTESDHLKKVLSAAGTTGYAELVPTICESFPIRDGMQKTINVFLHDPNLYTLEEVKRKHEILDPRHIVWIFKRLLSALGIAHRAGVVHGAVNIRHVLVNPQSHKIVLVGWGQSVKNGGIVKFACHDFMAAYPPEVKNKNIVGPGTDIFMAATCMLKIGVGSEMPIRMANFIRSCEIGGLMMRPSDAWEVHDEFDVMVRECFGKPRFIQLEM